MVATVVMLDSGPLGLVTNPNPSATALACVRWLQTLALAGTRILIPEIADYEVRRELLRANKQRGLQMLDVLARHAEFLPITTPSMREAARLWAVARQHGQPTAGDNTIDGDMILAGQVLTLGVPGVVVATTNVGHLSRFVLAELWPQIDPVVQ